VSKYDQPIDQWQDLAKYLNNYINHSGQIQRNDRVLWTNYLHKYNNTDWLGIVKTVLDLDEQHPEYLDLGNTSLFEDIYHKLKDPNSDLKVERQNIKAKRVMDRAGSVLDLPENKQDMWKMIMVLRELWCKIQDIDLPNSDISIGKLDEGGNNIFLFNR
jgi:hypothetical protein